MLTHPKAGGHSQKYKRLAPARAPIPDEASVRQHWLRKGVDAPDLATAKGFPTLLQRYELRQGRRGRETYADSVNTFAGWFFAGFIRITGYTDR
jgi:hypothetical protein